MGAWAGLASMAMSKMGKGGKGGGGAGGAVKSLEKIPENKASEQASSSHDGGAVASYKKGGKVKRTGMARLHKGEQVLKRSTAKKYRKRQGKE